MAKISESRLARLRKKGLHDDLFLHLARVKDYTEEAIKYTEISNIPDKALGRKVAHNLNKIAKEMIALRQFTDIL